MKDHDAITASAAVHARLAALTSTTRTGVLTALVIEHEKPRLTVPSLLTAENYNPATSEATVTLTTEAMDRLGRSERHSVRYKDRLRGEGQITEVSKIWSEVRADATGNHSVLTDYAIARLELKLPRYEREVIGYRTAPMGPMLDEGTAEAAKEAFEVDPRNSYHLDEIAVPGRAAAAGFTRSSREALFVASLGAKNPVAFWMLGQFLTSVDPHTGVAKLSRPSLMRSLGRHNEKAFNAFLRRTFSSTGWGSVAIDGDDVLITPSTTTCAVRAAWEVTATS